MKMNLTSTINIFSSICVIGSLHVAILDSRDISIGHLDTSANGPEETVTLCPQASGRKYFVLLTGTPNIHYSAEITDNVADISLNKPVSFQATKTTTLFKFKPTTDVTRKQLDITVSSQSDTVAYLKVSDICSQAMNSKCLDHSGSSLRLTFGKQGRITLSKASRPSLNTFGFRYIGISLKNGSGKDLTKSVKLILTSSFDYKYFGSLSFLFVLSLFGGVLVAVWGCINFRDPYILPQEDNSVDADRAQNLEMVCSRRTESEAWNTNESRALRRGTEQRITSITCKERCWAIKEVLFGHWVARNVFLYNMHRGLCAVDRCVSVCI